MKQPDTVKTDRHKVVFAIVGALCHRKGQDIFVEAVKKLPYQYLERSEFLIVGGPYEKSTAYIVKDFCKFWPNAKLLTEISHDELFELYKKIDCIVAPSRDDPLPVVFSKICVCSDNVGTSFYLEDGKNGFVFESENSDELCRKLMFLIDHFDELEPMRKLSRLIYESVFTNDIFSSSLLKIVEQNIIK
jgi:glycosyltransferase involved in cell wall biosynthesis